MVLNTLGKLGTTETSDRDHMVLGMEALSTAPHIKMRTAKGSTHCVHVAPIMRSAWTRLFVSSLLMVPTFSLQFAAPHFGTRVQSASLSCARCRSSLCASRMAADSSKIKSWEELYQRSGPITDRVIVGLNVCMLSSDFQS